MKDKLWNTLLTIAMAAVGFILNSAANELRDLKLDTKELRVIQQSVVSRVTSIESSRFTTQDGMKFYDELGKVRETMARMEGKMDAVLRTEKKP